WDLQRRLGRLHRSPRRYAFHFNGTPKKLAAFGQVEPIQILAGEGQARNGSVFGRVQDLCDAAVCFADLKTDSGSEVNLTDGIFSDSLYAAHPSRFRHLQAIEWLPIH